MAMRGDGGWGYRWYIRVHCGTAGLDVKTCHVFLEQSKILMHYKMLQGLPVRFCKCCTMLFHVWLNHRSGMHGFPRTGLCHQRGVPCQVVYFGYVNETFIGCDTSVFRVPSAVWLHGTFRVIDTSLFSSKPEVSCFFLSHVFFLDLIVLFDGLHSTCAQ